MTSQPGFEPNSDRATLSVLLAGDLWFSCTLWQYNGRLRRGMVVVQRIALVPQIRAVVMFRFSQVAFRSKFGRPVAYLLRSRIMRGAAADIHPGATVGPGLNLLHSVGVVIGRFVVAGRDLAVHQNVTIGDNGRELGQPVIGDHVFIGAGAKLLGPIRVGDRSRIGANAVVLSDVPSDCVAVGAPARSRARAEKPDAPHSAS